jgi:hypothetical protein
MPHRLLAAAALLAASLASHAEPWKGPIFDAHLHYNVEARDAFPIPAVHALFARNGVAAILANSRPNDGTRALYEASLAGKGPKVVPFIRVYRDRSDYGTWFDKPEIHAMVVAEERRGFYRGVGEFHLSGKSAATRVVKDIVDFAVAKDLVLHAHCDEEALEILFSHNPKARIIWAHTGFTTPLERVDELLRRYPELRGELSYRSDLVAAGQLSPGWRALFAKHPTRFLVGSDTWVNQRWESYSALMEGYREWLGQLPREVAERVAWRNAIELFALR